MATRTISNAGGNWGSVGTWVEGAVPTNADRVVATATSGNVTIAAAAVCLSADFTGYTGTLTHNAFNWTIGNSGTTDNSHLIFVSGMTYTTSTSTSCKITMAGRYDGITPHRITSAGKSIRNITFNNSLGRWATTDAITVPGTLLLSNGTIDFTNVGTNSAGGTIDTVTLTQQSVILEGNFYCRNFIASGSSVINPGSSTVYLTGGGTLGAGFNTFHNLNITGTLNVVDNVIYESNLTIAGGSVISFLPPDGSFTFNDPASVTLNGSAGNLVEFKSTSVGVQTSINGDGSSTYNFSYLKLTDSAAGLGIFNATHSENVGNNTGWNFADGFTGRQVSRRVRWRSSSGFRN